LIEVSQVRRRLVLAGGHQVAFRAEEVALPADFNVAIALRAIFLLPDRFFVRVAAVALGDGPWTRQRAIDRRDLVEHDVGVGPVERDPLLDDGLIVAVQRHPGRVECPWPAEAAGPALERVVAAVAVGIDPLADPITLPGRRGRLRPVAANCSATPGVVAVLQPGIASL